MVGGALAVLLAVVLGWHALRRLFNVPRVPRPRAMYVVLVALWAAVVALSGAAVAMALLLRDHQAADGRTRLGEVRCQVLGADRVEVELTAVPARVGDPERYQVAGDSCLISVVLVDLRPQLSILGPTRLWRIAGVGSQASARLRPSVNPEWLTPDGWPHLRPVNLLVAGTRQISLPVPAGGERFYLLTSPDGPTLEKVTSS